MKAKEVKGKALAKPNDVQKMLARYATDDAARGAVGGGGNSISLRGGKFSHQGATLGREIEVIILSFSHVKTYYGQAFDAENMTAPGCMAVSETGKDMVPVEDAPNKQAEACGSCPLNKFNTAEKGKGKACKDGRRLAVISTEVDDLSEAEIALITVPPSSLKNFAGYERTLHNKLKVPSLGVITKISMDEDAEWPTLDFEVVKQITDKKMLAMLIKRREDETNELLMGTPDFSNYVPPAAGKKGKKPAAKAAKKGSKAADKPAKKGFGGKAVKGPIKKSKFSAD